MRVKNVLMDRWPIMGRLFVLPVLLMIFAAGTQGQTGPVNAANRTKIYDIQYTTDPSGDSPYLGQSVVVRGVVTAIFFDGFTIAEAAGPWKSIFVYSFWDGPAIGDEVQVWGEVIEWSGWTQIDLVTRVEYLSTKQPKHIKPYDVPVQDVSQEMYESVLIRVEDVQVAALLSYNEWVVANTYGYAICNDYADYTYFPQMGDNLDAVNGILVYTYGAFKIEPRFTNDIEGSVIPHYGLQGTIVTMNGKRDILVNGYVEILGDKILDVSMARPNCPVYQVEGYIFPGLIDAHNHLSWNVLDLIPFGTTFNNRYEWRGSSMYGYPEHPIYTEFKTQINDIRNYGGSGAQTRNIYKLCEMRALTAGTTTMQGGAPVGIEHQGFGINNADRFPGKIYSSVDPLTIPVYYWQLLFDEYWDRVVVHLAEGKDALSLNEFYVVKNYGFLSDRLSIIHGVPLGPNEFADMAAAGSHLIWSPFSNMVLYNQTANVPAALDAGVNVALSVDWTPSGSFNLLDEMRYADWVDNTQWSDVLDAQDITEFATVNAAFALGLEDICGHLADDMRADIMVIPQWSSNPYNDLLAAESKDVMLTVVSGRPMYGNPALMNGFPFLQDMEDITISNTAKKVATRISSHYFYDSDKPIAAVMSELGDAYNAASTYLCDFLHYDPDFVGVPKRSREILAPESVMLSNYPNPFKSQTTITYVAPEDGMVTLRVYDALGREISTLVEGMHQRGSYSLEFNGASLASGIYLCTMEMSGEVHVQRMVVK